MNSTHHLFLWQFGMMRIDNLEDRGTVSPYSATKQPIFIYLFGFSCLEFLALRELQRRCKHFCLKRISLKNGSWIDQTNRVLIFKSQDQLENLFLIKTDGVCLLKREGENKIFMFSKRLFYKTWRPKVKNSNLPSHELMLLEQTNSRKENT